MPQTFSSPDFGTNKVPGAFVAVKVQNRGGGLASNGIVALVGEADGGPDFTLEDDLRQNAFGPDQIGAVRAKYRGGPILDAGRAAATPLNDVQVPGGISRMILVKTNPSTKASRGLVNWDSSAYGTLYDRSYGKLGNNISATVTAETSETRPTSGVFTWIPPVGTVNANLRANGGARLSLALSANTSPAAFVSAVDALSGVAATGGGARATIQNSVGTLAVGSISGNSATITYASGTFTETLSVGDTMVIPAASVIAGSGNANVGAWVVTAATSSTIVATKLSDAAKPGATPGTITAPTAVSAQAVSSTAANDLVVYVAVSFSLDVANPSPGLGKSLEVNELATGTDLLSRCTYALSTTPVTWVSKTGAPKLIVSASEYSAKLALARAADNASEEFVAGGDVALLLGYSGTTASATVSATTFSTSVTGGSGGNISASMANFPTLADLVAYINAQTGYTAAVGSAAIGTMAPSKLDAGTYGIATDFGSKTGRIKADAKDFFAEVSNSALVQFGNPAARADSGVPGPSALAFLSGGTRGATTQETFQAAIDALERVSCNFIVPLFSRDAADDIADGLTDSASTYEIASIHTYLRSHVIAMSRPKRGKNRTAALSIRGTFAASRAAAANLNSNRLTMSFLDQKVSSDTGIIQAQPWMDAVIAAAGAAAAFPGGIVAKKKNVSGSLQAARDWSDADITELEDALDAGLLPTKINDDGTFEFVSDQTTWSSDGSFFFNSSQATYLADVAAMTLKQEIERRFKGRSVADVGAAAIRTEVKRIMGDLKSQRIIAASDGFPLGYDEKSLSVTVSPPTAFIDVQIFLATLLYFFPISLGVNPVTQTA